MSNLKGSTRNRTYEVSTFTIYAIVDRQDPTYAYVGMTSNLSKRMANWSHRVRNSPASSSAVVRHVQSRGGLSNFDVVVLETLTTTRIEALDLETKHIIDQSRQGKALLNSRKTELPSYNISRVLISDTTRASIIACYESGMTLGQLAKDFGRCPSSISKIVRGF